MTPTAFKGIRRIDTIAHYETLVSTGSVVISGVTVTYDPNYLYIVDESNYYTISQVNSLINGVLAVTGQITVQTTDWNNNVATATFATLGTNDYIQFSPLTATDKINYMNADIFATVSGTTVTFTATTTPSADITLTYVIIRGIN